ncbi:TPA: hypothetical protein ACH1MH_000058 [Legionella pneumophila]
MIQTPRTVNDKAVLYTIAMVADWYCSNMVIPACHPISTDPPSAIVKQEKMMLANSHSRIFFITMTNPFIV